MQFNKDIYKYNDNYPLMSPKRAVSAGIRFPIPHFKGIN